jgi:MFS family permease
MSAVAEPRLRQEELLPGLRGALHHKFVLLRHRAESGFMLLSRVFQGIGGGGLAPVEQTILVDTFPPEKRASAFALYTIAIVTAPAIGPVLGGWITDTYTWRWVFFINIPIGLRRAQLHWKKPRSEVDSNGAHFTTGSAGRQ